MIYFILTSLFFFLAIRQGNEGVVLRLFGGSDDGLFYWEQAKNVAAGREAILTSIYPIIIGYLVKITGIENVFVVRLFNYMGFILLTILGLHLLKIFFENEGEEKNLDIKCLYDARIVMLLAFMLYGSLIMNVTLSIYRDIWIYALYLMSTILSIKVFFGRGN